MSELIFNYKNSALVSKAQLERIFASLKARLNELRQISKQPNGHQPEHIINLAFDKNILVRIKTVLKNRISKRLRYVLVIGIGGSNLGAQAVYEARRVGREQSPQLIFLDTVDPLKIAVASKIVGQTLKHPEEILVLIITKSGITTETIVNAELILKTLLKSKSSNKDRVIVLTESNSPLWSVAEAQGFPCLPHEAVGGRYAIFSSVGLLPLSVAGLDVNSFLRGAQKMRTRCLSPKLTLNPAALSAIILYWQWRQGKTINDNFFFQPELESLGKWYRQLMAESLGKKRNVKNKVVHAGITPLVSIGSTDLHSMAQLYLGGPRDKITSFVFSEQGVATEKISSPRYFPKIIPALAGKDAGGVMKAIYAGVMAAYRKEKLPFTEVRLPDIFEESLGSFMQFKMMEIIFLAHLLEVNPFDQPQVNLYKNQIQKLLNG